MKEIKNCPFCGGNRLEVDLINVEHANRNIAIPEYVVRNAPPAIRIICRNCLASMTKTFGVKIELFSEVKIINEITDELIDNWNNRVQDSETQLKAERLNRLDEWQKDLDDREDSLNERENEIDEKLQKYEKIRNDLSQDKLIKLNQLSEWEDELHNRSVHNTEWEQGLDDREDKLRHKEEELNQKQLNAQSLENWRKQLDFQEKYLERRDLAIGEKLQRYLEIRDEMAKLLKNIDDQNNEIYKRINDLLENTEGEDGDAPLEMLNLTLSTIRNAKNKPTEQS